MPPGNKEPIDIVKITEKTLVLFESINIIFNKPNEPALYSLIKINFVECNNLINNAIEASQKTSLQKL